MGSFKRLLIGSTSDAVANQASVPVVVVPDGWKRSDHTGPVLVGLDDSGESDAAIEFAVAAATGRHARLRIVHIWDLPSIYSWDSMTIAGLGVEWAEAAQRHIEAIADQWRHKYPELEIEVDVTRGHPVEGVIAAAESAEAQLLVVGGRHRHRRLTAVLLGSVSRGVLQHATCPVAVVHVPRDDA
jgi:nucleotide-binding universal stress UspA family protein